MIPYRDPVQAENERLKVENQTLHSQVDHLSEMLFLATAPKQTKEPRMPLHLRIFTEPVLLLLVICAIGFVAGFLLR